MQMEKSCGALVLRREDGRWKVLLVQNKNGGHWAFPKGHVEEGETEKQTAIREVKEETGLTIEINTDFRMTTQYSPKKDVIKDVVYFLSVVNTAETVRQVEEIDDVRWMSFSRAKLRVTFRRDKEILEAAQQYAREYLK
jgi:8-oxo-dGTP pyrophosphatase MutT (NUDIX family)